MASQLIQTPISYIPTTTSKPSPYSFAGAHVPKWVQVDSEEESKDGTSGLQVQIKIGQATMDSTAATVPKP